MARILHRWLERGERIRWHAAATRGPSDSRQVGGRLYVTNRRLVFAPFLRERFADPGPWDAPIDEVRLTLVPGSWIPRFKLLEPLALRYGVTVQLSRDREEHFFLTHAGMLLEQLASVQVPVAVRPSGGHSATRPPSRPTFNPR